VARLTPSEFRELIDELVKVDGAGKLQEKLLRSRALVSRRRLGSVDQLSRQLYQLTLGLDRDGIVSQVVVALWEERLRQGLDEEASKRLEEIGEKVNACLAGGRELDPAKEGDLRSALTEYRNALAEHVGDVAARLTMLVRAFPAVARLLRDEAGSA
jgi:DNA-directed RNA polymerase subunit F